MTRHLLFVAILGLLSTRLAAEEKAIRFIKPENSTATSEPMPGIKMPELVAATDDGVKARTDQENSTPTSELMPGIKMPSLVAVADDGVESKTSKTPHDEALPLGSADATSLTERGFHPACDCGCHIECLDHWCPCESSCCTTDCWVEYPCQCSHGNCYRTEDGRWVSNDACCDVEGTPVCQSDGALRFGWWGISNQGSQTKTGEFQSLQPSPFYELDAISSDGKQTWDVVMTGLDNEDSDARLRYYGPAVSAKVDYERFLRRLDHDPLAGYSLDNPATPPPGPNDNVATKDLNVGENYAIRVEELSAKFKGQLTDNLKWRLNFWDQKKFGERQVNATAHCFNVNAPAPAGANGNVCHVLSQRQTIDWETVELQPVLEAKLGIATVEYSHTMRSFSQDDGVADRMYTRFNFNLPAASGFLGPEYDYAMVPDSLTQTDRIKVGAQLTEDNQFYGNVYNGDTKNEFRDTHRSFDGFDLRLMNTSFDRVKLTGYASMYNENNELPPSFLNAPPLSPAPVPPATLPYDQLSANHPIDYSRTRAGLKGSWQPWQDQCSCYPAYGLWNGTSLTGGYEYYFLQRDYATYNTVLGPFTQPDTTTHQINFGPTTRWSSSLETFVRAKTRMIHVPLIGVRENNGRFNSNQPEQEDGVDVGGTWTPTENFMATTQVGFVNSWQHSQYANFNENNYPIVSTLWYAPTRRLSFTGGYAYYSDWIDQDITLGFVTPGVMPPPFRTETTRWNYGGQNHLFSINANYAWSDCVQLVGGYEWDRGNDSFSLPPSPAGADWSALPSLSDVIVETQRLTAGVDWQPYRNWNLYLRYIFNDYNDIGSGLDSGTTHMVLAGGSVNW